MSSWAFDIVGARVEPYAAVPTLMFRLSVRENESVDLQSLALRIQVRIEPQRRPYTIAESDRVVELFGERPRWSDTLKPFLWTHAALTIPGFRGSTEIDLPVTCTYDLEVAASKYFHALDNGQIPLLFLFSGTAFIRADGGLRVEQVPWDREASFRLPVATWRELMDRYFPNSGWLRLGRDSIDALTRFKARNALPTWDAAIDALLERAGEGKPV